MNSVFLSIVLLARIHSYIINNANNHILNKHSLPENIYSLKSQENDKHLGFYPSQQVGPLYAFHTLRHSSAPSSTDPSEISSASLSITSTKVWSRLNATEDEKLDELPEEEYDEEGLDDREEFDEDMDDEYEDDLDYEEDGKYNKDTEEDETDYEEDSEYDRDVSDVDTPDPFEYNSRGELYVPAIQRLQRRRSSKPIRRIFRENLVSTSNLILPLFVQNETVVGTDGINFYSPDDALKRISDSKKRGITTFLLIPRVDDQLKDQSAREGYNPDGLLPNLIAKIKEKVPNVNIIADVNVSPYTKDGIDGLVTIPGEIDNDATVQQVARQAVTFAEAGADMVSVSDILDGTSAVTREILDMEGFTNVSILSHVAKFSSSLLLPQSTPSNQVDKMSFLNDASNNSDVLLKLSELGASDAVVIEPSLLYLDLVARVKKTTNLPVIAYQSPGEVKLIKAGSNSQAIYEKNFVFEYLKSCKRAGADLIITHYADSISKWLEEDLRENGQLNFTDLNYLSSPLLKSQQLSTGFLDNGMEYVIYPHSNPPNSVSAYLEIHSGSIDEKDNQLGIAHFCEHVTYMGSRKRQALLEYSIKTNAFTDFHHTVFYATTHNPSQLKNIFEALDDVIKGDNQFTNERLEKERAAILSEASIIDTLEYRKNCVTVKNLHSDNILSKRFPIGDLSELQNYKIDNLKEYQLYHYTPANSTLFIVGDVNSSIIDLVNDVMGKFNRTGRNKNSPSNRINHRFDKKTEFNISDSSNSEYVTIELMKKQAIKPLITLEGLKSNLLRKIVLRGLSFNFDICHRGSDYISCIVNDFDCVNEGCNIQSLSLKSNEKNWGNALEKAISHLYGMNFNAFPWDNLISTQILEGNKLLPENLQLKELVPLIMEHWSCGHTLMDLKDLCQLNKQICESLTQEEAQKKLEDVFNWIENPHSAIAFVPKNFTITTDLFKNSINKILSEKDMNKSKVKNNLSLNSLVTEEEILNLKAKSEDSNDVAVYKFDNGCTASYKDLNTNDNSFHLKISIPSPYNGEYNSKLLLAAHSMMEGGAIASKTREQVELYCCSNLINVNVEYDGAFMTINISAHYNMIESILQLSHYLLDECRIEEDAFERAKVRVKNLQTDLINNLQEFSIAKNIEYLYPGSTLLSVSPESINNFRFEEIQQLLYNTIKESNINIALVGPSACLSKSIDDLLKLYIGTISHNPAKPPSISSNFHIQENPEIKWNKTSDNDTRAAVTFSGYAPNAEGFLPNGESIFEKLKTKGLNRKPDTSLVFTYGMLIQQLLGSRAFTSLREEDKLTYETNVKVETPVYNRNGYFSVTVNCIPDNIDKVISAAMNMLQEIRSNRPFTQYHLDRVKSQLLDSTRLSQPTTWIDSLTIAQGREGYLENFIPKIGLDELQFVFNNLYGTESRFIHTTVITMN